VVSYLSWNCFKLTTTNLNSSSNNARAINMPTSIRKPGVGGMVMNDMKVDIPPKIIPPAKSIKSLLVSKRGLSTKGTSYLLMAWNRKASAGPIPSIPAITTR
jgi:hypothetical protein